MKIHPLLAATIFALGACSALPAEHRVNLQLTNTGPEPIDCKIAYGHWVEQALGRLDPGMTFDVALRQQARDHALFVYRDDMQRRLMIENILCGRPGNGYATNGQIDLAALRRSHVAYVEATCAAPTGPGRVSCQITDLAAGEQ